MKRLAILCAFLVMLSSSFLCSCSTQKESLNEQDIKAICELATVKCYYNNVAKIEKEADNIFQKDRKMWIEYEGEVAIGIKMDEVKVQINGEQITISCPDATILSYNVVQDSFEYVTSKDGLLFKNKITVEEEQEAIVKAENEMVASASENKAAFDLAEQRAKELIENYINKIGEYSKTTYTITWE